MWFDSIHHCRCGWYQFILLKLERTDLLSSAVSPNQINLTNRLKVIPIHADGVLVTTNVTVKHWNEIPLVDLVFFPHPLRAFKLLVHMSTNLVWLIAHVLLRLMHPVLQIQTPQMPLNLMMRQKNQHKSLTNVEEKCRSSCFSFIYEFCFNFRMIFIFYLILTFRSSLFIVNSILTFYRFFFYFIYADIAYMIYYNFLMALTNSLSDIPSKLGSCFYVFQTKFLTVNFLYPTGNFIQCPFQQAGILLFGSQCFCIISKHGYFLNNIRNYLHAKTFQKPLTTLFNNFS